MRPDGMRLGGMRPRDMRPRGMRPRGMRPRGMRPRGMRPRGMRPRGMRLSGVRLSGMRVMGMCLMHMCLMDMCLGGGPPGPKPIGVKWACDAMAVASVRPRRGSFASPTKKTLPRSRSGLGQEACQGGAKRKPARVSDTGRRRCPNCKSRVTVSDGMRGSLYIGACRHL